MSTSPIASKTSPLVLVNSDNGITLIPSATPLTRLNYFDGKFLRADDLRAEQAYLRRLVELSNQAGGSGVAYGYDVTLGASGNTLELSAGLALDSAGRVLLLPAAANIDIPTLLERSKLAAKTALASGSGEFGDCQVVATTPPGTETPGNNLYVITICHAEALCGTEDVFGKLCEEACAKSTDRPNLVEGILVRAVPLVLRTPFPDSKAVSLIEKHLRSMVASAYYEDERQRVASLITESGLRSEAWCLGAKPDRGGCVPVAVLARRGTGTVFLDAWTARRERIDTPAKRYWQWRMAMRPWDVYLAQILQFQCQLRDLVTKGGGPGDDPCSGANRVIKDANEAIAAVTEFHRLVTARFATLNLRSADVPTLTGGASRLSDLAGRLTQAQLTLTPAASKRALIDGGIVELPAAGYLPVVPGDALPVNGQVRNFMGEGVDLRFCVVRPDFVAHALEEAQHMERLSLLEGLDNPSRMPEVDILVPDGVIVGQGSAKNPAAFEAAGNLLFNPNGQAALSTGSLALSGAAHIEQSQSTLEFYAALSTAPRKFTSSRLLVSANLPDAIAIWVGATAGKNPFAGDTIGQTVVDARLVCTSSGTPIQTRVSGVFSYRRSVSGTETIVQGEVRGAGGTVPLRLSLSGGAAPALRIEFAAGSQRLAFVFGRDAAQRVTLAAEIVNPFKGGSTPLANAVFTPNADVLRTDNELHAIALRAIALVAKQIAEQGFQETAAQELFPPPTVEKPETIVRATLPWVLFHRRRNKRCAAEEVQPAPAVNRLYRVFHLLLPGASNVKPDDVRAALRANDSAFFQRNQLEFRVVDVVEFRGGVPVLDTDPNKFPQDWQNVPHGAQILHAAIANNPAADDEGDALSVARLDTLDTALRTSGVFSSVNLIAGPELLDQVPAVLNASGVDGAMALVSQQVQTAPFLFKVSAEILTVARGNLIRVGDISLEGRATTPATAVNVTLTVTYNAPVVNPTTALPSLHVDSPAVDVTAARVVGRVDAIVFNNVPLTLDATNRKWTITNVLVDTTNVTGTSAEAAVSASLSVQSPAEQPVTVTPNIVQVARIRDVPQRNVRFVAVGDTNSAGQRFIRSDVPLLTVSIAEDGTLSTAGFPAKVLDELKRAGPFGGVEMDTVTGAPDANADKRLKVFVASLKPVLAATPRVAAVRALPPVDRQLATDSNVNFDDIVFLTK